jgi:motility quorum-sensing regulator / GCU-specific mRNA interferase toxin
MTEKRKPTYDIGAFKAAFSNVDRLSVTGTALRSAAAYANPRLWQDVYHVPSPVGELYVKFTADADTEFLLLSFKEKDDD